MNKCQRGFNNFSPLISMNGLKISILTSTFFFSLIGKCLGKLKLLFNHISSINKNPYIYFRELPNNFGIGVTSLLFDSTLENEKDIVAVILDLCARKYLSLEYHGDKYTIHMLEKNPTNLLSNESYIFYALKRNNFNQNITMNFSTKKNYNRFG